MDTHTVTPTSSVVFGWDYIVTLSYAEEEEETTGMNNFVGKLHASLKKANFKTFKGKQNPEGWEQMMMISKTRKKGIEGSKCAVIIFSRNFASSTRCLEEVALMMECRNKFSQTVFPVFLMDVEGKDVRRQKGRFEEPFRKHEQCFNQEVVDRWRSSLKIAGELAGLNFKDISDRDEEKLIAKIVKDVSAVLSEIPPPNAVMEMYTDPITANQPSTQCKLQEMLGFIGDPQIDIVGLYGMGGVGKTTLAKQVNNHFQNNLFRGIKIPFDIVIMVTVSATPDVQSIRASVTMRLGLLETTQVDALSKALSKKRFLLILDDVWCKLNLEDIGIPRPTQNNKGSKIVVISRNQDTCTDMDARETIKAQPLSQVESWDLFVARAGEHVTADNIKHLAEKIVERCKGLPLAIVTVARAMANRNTVGSWENALREMELSSSELRGMKEEVFVPLKFSFDRLENDLLRSLFLYCACFPEDYSIGDEYILTYCVGEGLVDKLGSLKAARAKGEDLTESLKIACMLEDGNNTDAVKMHDMIRDLALWITSSSYCDSSYPKLLVMTDESVEEAPLANEWVDLTRISLIHSKIKELTELEGTCPKLTTLLSKGSSICIIPPTNFFQHMNHLGVLDLSSTKLKCLPDSTSCLENLRVLRLRACHELTYLPPLGMFRRLQVLELAHCGKLYREMFKPEDKGCERSIRYLNTDWSSVTFVKGAVARLEKLEVARTSHKFNYRGIDAPESIDVEELFHLKYLRSVTIYFTGITISSWFKKLDDKISNLWVTSRLVEEHAMDTLDRSQNLESMFLTDCQGVTRVPMAARETCLGNCEALEIVMDCAMVFQTKDRGSILRLCNLPNLKSIGVGVTQSSSFCRLQIIHLKGCNSLKMVFTKGMPRLFNKLTDISVTSCSKMEVIIETAKEEKEEVGESISPFPKLDSLILEDLPALHDLCSRKHILRCPLIRNVTVNKCPRLKKDPLNVQAVDGLVEVKSDKWEIEEVEEI